MDYHALRMEILKTQHRKILIFVSVPLDPELGMTENISVFGSNPNYLLISLAHLNLGGTTFNCVLQGCTLGAQVLQKSNVLS